MRLFAPKNDWTMTSPAGSNWWNNSGTFGTAAGIRIDESSAMTLSAVFAATRVISETMASLPCSLLEQVDYRTTAKATGKSLWSIMHDQPNPEQDIMSWMDSQVAFQLNWGNAYAEIQRNSLGEIVALWPIHPSRIPLKNIVRNGTNPVEYDGIVAGLPGEIVYFVNNDDGSRTPIPASDMFHVPGVLSANGVTGQSIIKWGATSIGNAIAADMHAGAVFKNGAVTNMALKSQKIVGKETADMLRSQWQSTFGGVQNHYKTLFLEDGIEPVVINMNPEVTQLLETRQFSVAEVARWYRLPPHLLADLSQASFSNIEAEGLSFVVYSMLPWIVRWEKAMQRQLLTEEEKKIYRFKFNVNGLLRGDQAARAQFYQTMFNLGAYSPNDIRSKEDENPVEGGDQYFIQGNNAVPLDKIGELTQANIDKVKAPAPQPQPPADTKAHLAELRTNYLADMRFRMEQMCSQVETSTGPGLAANVKELVVHHLDGLQESNAKEIAVIVGEINREGTYNREMMISLDESLSKNMANLPSSVANAVNYRASDEAVKLLEQAARTTTAARDAIRLGIQAEIEQLQRYEIRTVKDAMKRPKEFPAWRDSFYQNFTVKLTAAINVFSVAAGHVSVTLDADAIAKRYAAESVGSLEPADTLPMSDFESGVEAAIETWIERPKQFAKSLFRSAV